jgi:hypothetical protein
VVECHTIANLKGRNFPAHMISCLTEIPLYRLIIYIDGRILWCTHSLLLLETCLMMIQKSLPKVSINITWSTGSFKAHIWYSIFCPLHLVHLRTMYILNCIQGSSWDHMVVGYTTTYATTDVVSSNLNQGEVYNIMWSSLSVTCDRSIVFSGSSSFLHQ